MAWAVRTSSARCCKAAEGTGDGEALAGAASCDAASITGAGSAAGGAGSGADAGACGGSVTGAGVRACAMGGNGSSCCAVRGAGAVPVGSMEATSAHSTTSPAATAKYLIALRITAPWRQRALRHRSRWRGGFEPRRKGRCTQALRWENQRRPLARLCPCASR